jgi:peptidoglycan/xylan/chitin deacetylase (PgdA/CDA1 family)
VSLTFDDGLPSQVEVALPLLAEHELRATFYVNPRGDEWLARLAPWRDAANVGHEVGNHSLTHPCSGAFDWSRPGRGLEDLTLADIEADVLEAERRLREAIPGQTVRSFCYPCYLDYVGQGPTRHSYVPIIARHFVAGRGKGEIPNHPDRSDLHYLWSFPVERMSGAELIGLAERAAATGRWSILTFHGINQGHLPVAEIDLRELCAFLARQRGRIWTAPVATIAQRLVDYRRDEKGMGAATGGPPQPTPIP